MFGREKGEPSKEEAEFQTPENKRSLSEKELDKIVKSTKEYQELNNEIEGLAGQSEQIPWATEVKSVEFTNIADYKKELEEIYDKKMNDAKEIAKRLETKDGAEKVKEGLEELKKVEKEVEAKIELREKLLKEAGQ